jgi:hypothetical protein
VYCFDVLEQNVFDVIRDIGRVAQGADAHGTTFVTCNILNINVAAVAFDGDTVLRHGLVGV